MHRQPEPPRQRHHHTEHGRYQASESTHICAVNHHLNVFGVSCPAFAKKHHLGGASFINALPRGHPSINCILKTITYPETVELKFAVALRQIQVGEELFVHYGTKLSTYMAFGGRRAEKNFVAPLPRSMHVKRPILNDDGKSPKRTKTRSFSSRCGEPIPDEETRSLFLSTTTLFQSNNMLPRLAEHSNGLVLLPECTALRPDHWRLSACCDQGLCTHPRLVLDQERVGDIVLFGRNLAHMPFLYWSAQPGVDSKLGVVGMQLFFERIDCGGRQTRTMSNYSWHATASLDEDSRRLCKELTLLLLGEWDSDELKPFQPKGVGTCMGTFIKRTTIKLSYESALSLATRFPRFKVLVTVITLVQQVYELKTTGSAVREIWFNIKKEGGRGSTFGGHFDVFLGSWTHSGTASLPIGFVSFDGDTPLLEDVSLSCADQIVSRADKSAVSKSAVETADFARLGDDVVASTGMSRAHAHAHAQASNDAQDAQTGP